MTRILILIIAVSLPLSAQKKQPEDRSIKSDDFTKSRPQPKRRPNRPEKPKTYHQASPSLAEPLNKNSPSTLRVGVTIWKVERLNDSESVKEVARRVEADTKFHEGDLLRLSIESPRAGYLYVVDRDWFTNGSSGETKLIFPLLGEDNELQAGKLIDIPAAHDTPFKASPKANQAGEMLTIIVTSERLSLPLSKDFLTISSAQLAEWERMWSGMTERFEMNGGAGLTRTLEEQEAASPTGSRQLTRDDPSPQTIYFLSPRSRNGLLFNLLLSYVK
ncbi:MAG TPA: DUF4384 domain-containing protein [Pyrinomonadaceae bacterium]|nr:DUF4384 domain-containing protein [Pyrinomonadaceae bacterium]